MPNSIRHRRKSSSRTTIRLLKKQADEVRKIAAAEHLTFEQMFKILIFEGIECRNV